MKKRVSSRRRVTTETSVDLRLGLDGPGVYTVRTTLPFLDHMLELFARHGHFSLTVNARGDTHIDDHHLVEDIGLTFGEALAEALGDKRGINRYGQALNIRGQGRALTPMDETLSYIALDLSGRPYFDWKVKFSVQNKAPFCFELLEDFFQAVAMSARMNLHIKLMQGRNNHHIAESLFKGFGRALAQAVAVDPKRKATVPSTKGSL
ncbi:MAG: imidazoleglycerol-phosphate dehydratase HisB [Elusimicrobia bacterium]|nr:imidazoleglycerol-phosphate dehydratase HisB [Elusimicrobiota bacterium]